MIFLGRFFVFFAEENLTVFLRLFCSRRLLGKLFLFYAQEIILHISGFGVKWSSQKTFLFSLQKKTLLYISSCDVKWYCYERFLFSSLKKILLYLSGCGVQWYCYVIFLLSRRKKLCCESQVLVLNDFLRKAFYFLCRRKLWY